MKRKREDAPQGATKVAKKNSSASLAKAKALLAMKKAQEKKKTEKKWPKRREMQKGFTEPEPELPPVVAPVDPILDKFKQRITPIMKSFVKSETRKEENMGLLDKRYRMIVHDIADDIGVVTCSVGLESVAGEKHLIIYKREHAPTTEEMSRMSEMEIQELAGHIDNTVGLVEGWRKAAAEARRKHEEAIKSAAESVPVRMSKKKTKEAEKAANLKLTTLNKDKKDLRTIEEIQLSMGLAKAGSGDTIKEKTGSALPIGALRTK